MTKNLQKLLFGPKHLGIEIKSSQISCKSIGIFHVQQPPSMIQNSTKSRSQSNSWIAWAIWTIKEREIVDEQSANKLNVLSLSLSAYWYPQNHEFKKCNSLKGHKRVKRKKLERQRRIEFVDLVESTIINVFCNWFCIFWALECQFEAIQYSFFLFLILGNKGFDRGNDI